MTFAKIHSIVLLLLSALWLPSLLQAHNGEVARAVPLTDIRLDGDLSDWPDHLQRYAITRPEFGQRPTGPEDFSGWFSLGYNAAQNALYIAVEMKDDQLVVPSGTHEGNWNTDDGCELYIDLAHQQGNYAATQYALWGNTPWSLGSAAQVAVQRHGGVHHYEWGLDIERKTEGQVRLQPGMSLGFDLVLLDIDTQQENSYISWGPGITKYANSSRLGDVLLTTADDPTGQVNGSVTWADQEPVAYAKVQAHSLDHDAMWLQTKTDRQGYFAMDLPPGRYQVEVQLGRGREAWPAVQIEKDSRTRTDLKIAYPQGVQVAASDTLKAGSGILRGHWQSYSTTDGLAGGSVRALIQDRTGALWFGKRGTGLSRFDGQTFIHFTNEDSRISNSIWALLEDKQGNIWIGTRGGLSRYNGGFTNFTTEDGLTSNFIWTLRLDRRGHLWIGTGGGWGDSGVGISRYNGQTFTNFTTEDGLTSNSVWSLLEDREGNLWIGTDGGASRYGGSHFEHFGSRDGLSSNFLSTVLEDRQGVLWVGTDSGLNRYEGQAFTNHQTLRPMGQQRRPH
jgi:hypothetical protein